ncbi:hypothetical protein J7L05_00605 [bacterium]|nr:hypothetical protein [bacterium]
MTNIINDKLMSFRRKPESILVKAGIHPCQSWNLSLSKLESILVKAGIHPFPEVSY